MGSRRIKKDANQNVDHDKETSSAKKRLQKAHFGSHPPVDACDPGRPRLQRSSHSAELVPRGTLQQQTCLLHSWRPEHAVTLVTIVHV
jgi:hypothetical protein